MEKIDSLDDEEDKEPKLKNKKKAKKPKAIEKDKIIVKKIDPVGDKGYDKTSQASLANFDENFKKAFSKGKQSASQKKQS